MYETWDISDPATENFFPICCSDKFVGTIVPTKIVGTPNGGFPLAVPTNLSERHIMFNSVGGGGVQNHGIGKSQMAGFSYLPISAPHPQSRFVQK